MVKGLKMSTLGVPYGSFGLIRVAEAIAIPSILFSVSNQVLISCEKAKGGDRSVQVVSVLPRF